MAGCSLLSQLGRVSEWHTGKHTAFPPRSLSEGNGGPGLWVLSSFPGPVLILVAGYQAISINPRSGTSLSTVTRTSLNLCELWGGLSQVPPSVGVAGAEVRPVSGVLS